MNPCAEARFAPNARTLLVGVLALAVLAGCAARKPKTPASTPTTPATEAPVDPAADKGDPEGRFAEALELMRQKKAPEAEAAFLALSRDFPDFSGPHANLGILLAKSNRRDAAIAAFTRAVTANAQNASAYNWLGILNREAGLVDRARQNYEKALALKPDYAAAHLNLGLLLEDRMNQPAKALEHYREYLRITDGKDLRVLPWIAEIEARQPKAEAAAVETEVKK